MKTNKLSAIILGIIGYASAAYANYEVIFSTYRNADANAYASNPVFDVGGTVRLDNTFRATLWVGATSDPLLMTLAGAPETFVGDLGAGGNFAGHIDGPTYTITDAGVSPGGTAFYQIRAWRASDGATFGIANATPGAHTGVSAVTQFTAGGTPAGTPAPPPIQAFANSHPSFTLSVVPAVIPEPSVLALGLLGGAALMFRRRK